MKLKFIDVDINKLKTFNLDTIGFIKVMGTNINYPFVQSTDNDYYLNRSYDKTYNNAGWIFLDYRNNEFNDKNTIIYGHGRINGTMFGSLKDTLKSSWQNNKDNYIIKISDEEKAHKLLNKLVADGINIDKFEIKKPTLNDIFIEKVGE